MLKQEQPTLKQKLLPLQIKSRCRLPQAKLDADAKAKLAANAKTKTSAEVAAREHCTDAKAKISAEVAAKAKLVADTKQKSRCRCRHSAKLAADTRAKAEAKQKQEAETALKLVKMIIRAMDNIADSFDAESKRQMELISLNVSVTSRQNDLNEISRKG
jgi:hypothetical protein